MHSHAAYSFNHTVTKTNSSTLYAVDIGLEGRVKRHFMYVSPHRYVVPFSHIKTKHGYVSLGLLILGV